MKNVCHGMNILLSGGSSGIGGSIARALVDEGANVGIISRRNPDSWTQKPELWDSKKNWIKADLKRPQEIVHAVESWQSSLHGNIDAVILCAATYASVGRHRLEETSLEEWRELIDVNTTAPFVITKHVIGGMLSRGEGLIIGITSDVAYGPGPGRVGYSVSKTAMRAMLDGVAEELSNTNVKIAQLFPKKQVKTEGIMGRRPAKFDFEGYSDPSIFSKPIIQLIVDRNFMNNSCYIVGDDGETSSFER